MSSRSPQSRRRSDSVDDRAANTGGGNGRRGDSAAFGAGLDELVGYNLRRAHGVQKQRFAAVFGPLGIRPLTLSALGTIHDHPGISQTELGRLLNIKRANMVPLMAELEGRGLIVRRPSNQDRRIHVISLTPAGQKFTVRLLDLHARLEDDLARSLGAEDRDRLVELLRRFGRLAGDPRLPSAD
jgi:DNA-binding MarR family transcriptional regulator